MGSDCSLMAVKWQVFKRIPQGSPGHHPWWLQLPVTVTSLFPDGRKYTSSQVYGSVVTDCRLLSEWCLHNLRKDSSRIIWNHCLLQIHLIGVSIFLTLPLLCISSNWQNGLQPFVVSPWKCLRNNFSSTRRMNYKGDCPQNNGIL